MKREFQLPKNAIETEAAIDIAAPPAYVAAIYRAVDQWGETFPLTIEQAKVIQTGENWKEVEVAHRQEGCVPNTLFDLSPVEIGLQESKQKFNASFVNRFEPAPGAGRTMSFMPISAPKDYINFSNLSSKATCAASRSRA